MVTMPWCRKASWIFGWRVHAPWTIQAGLSMFISIGSHNWCGLHHFCSCQVMLWLSLSGSWRLLSQTWAISELFSDDFCDDFWWLGRPQVAESHKLRELSRSQSWTKLRPDLPWHHCGSQLYVGKEVGQQSKRQRLRDRISPSTLLALAQVSCMFQSEPLSKETVSLMMAVPRG